MQTDRTLADFAGAWAIERTITPTVGPVARLEGTARWVPMSDGLDYFERGVLQMEGAAPMHVERKYHWTQDLSVFFDDGRFFHRVPCSGGRTEHFCDPDTYVGTYDFTAWPSFNVTWDVSGPRKGYISVTRFSRKV
ncbi:DUF6314 family protein [uncultured Tateyamaria sp.]|uniref:DUF6314 family protein n=1 Tax=uncultured Tateyamaria sp. TaxID=455651 RepID=UPI002638B225|nr:DUF6314 family protein [uncultured Tateyamaria sp.]